MDYIKIDRLNEHHENQLPDELLNMTVKDLLDRVGELDTAGDAEYEIVEDALIALKDKILGNGYPADEVNFDKDQSVEGEDEVDFTPEEQDDDFPTFDQAQSNGNENKDRENQSIDNFNF